MRVIKFRAWIAKENKMVGVSGLYFLGAGFPKHDGRQALYEIDYRRNKKDFVFEFEEDVVLLQYTGLKDKNGKEIYEGDVIQHETWSVNDYSVGLVKFHKDRFIVKHDYDVSEWGDSLWDVVQFKGEVIGNIYEHSHLLEGSK